MKQLKRKKLKRVVFNFLTVGFLRIGKAHCSSLLRVSDAFSYSYPQHRQQSKHCNGYGIQLRLLTSMSAQLLITVKRLNITNLL